MTNLRQAVQTRNANQIAAQIAAAGLPGFVADHCIANGQFWPNDARRLANVYRNQAQSAYDRNDATEARYALRHARALDTLSETL